jgi:hypothetical protein
MSDAPKLTLDEIRNAASRLVQAGGEIRARLNELTVQALTQRDLAEREIRDVLHAITEGVSLGAEQRAAEVRGALSDALHGMDDALGHAAEAMQLAIREVAADARAFGNNDLQQGLSDLRKLEEMLLETVGKVAAGTSGLVRQEMTAVVEHGRRIGTDTGGRVRAVADDLGNRVRASVQEAASVGKSAAREVSARLAALSSRKLADISARLAEKAESLKQK